MNMVGTALRSLRSLRVLPPCDSSLALPSPHDHEASDA
jgi:hypothetical protein